MKQILFLLSAFVFLTCDQNAGPTEIWTIESNPTSYDSFDTYPKVVVLYPRETQIASEFEGQLQELNDTIELYRDEYILRNQNAKENALNEIEREVWVKTAELWEKADAYALIPIHISKSFSDKFHKRLFIEEAPDFIYAEDIHSTDNLKELEEIASAFGVDYIINIPKVETIEKFDMPRTTINFQLYDRSRNQLVIDLNASGNSTEQYLNDAFGYPETIKGNALLRSFYNAIDLARIEFKNYFSSHNPNLSEWRVKERTKELKWGRLYYEKMSFEIPKIIAAANPKIDTAGYYHGFLNEEEGEFIGFFMVDASKNKNSNGNENLIENYFHLKAKIVIGTRENGRWYCDEKEDRTFFAAHLDSAKIQYFRKEISSDYFVSSREKAGETIWESGYFQIVRDFSIDSSLFLGSEDDYYAYIKKYQPYVGMHQHSADLIIEEKITEKEQLITNELSPKVMAFFEELVIKENAYDYILQHEHPMIIFPENRSVYLTAVLLRTGKSYELKSHLHYYVFFDNDDQFYEWTYYEPERVSGGTYSNKIFFAINELTSWNFRFPYLDDQHFWDEYVLKKENGEYKYLDVLANN